MILYTFLDEYDLSGKTIVPFNTSGGSGFSGSLDTIAEMEPDAEITEGLSLGSSEAEDCADMVSGWLNSIGLAGLNILVREYRCSGGTDTANPAAGNRCSGTEIPHLIDCLLPASLLA